MSTKTVLLQQIVEYFPQDMAADATASRSTGGTMSECTVDNVEAGSQVTVRLQVYVSALSDAATMEAIDANLLGDSSMCDKMLYSGRGNETFSDSLDATSYGKNPDEFCGVRFADGHMGGLFIQNAQDMAVEMWLDPPDSVEQYDVREEVMPYIMEGTRKFHSDRLCCAAV